MKAFFSPFLLIAALVTAVPQPAAAQAVERIVAIVNDQVVSSYDLDQRLALALSATGQPDTPQNRASLRSQVLNALINEKLQMQEATRLHIVVSKSDLDKALAIIAKQNNVTAGHLKEFLAAKGVPEGALAAQLKAEIAWSRVVRQKIGPNIHIGDQEVKRALDKLKAERNATRYNVSEIFLAADRPGQYEAVKKAAAQLVAELRKGADFGAVARQFSQANNASKGGELGWVTPDTLPPQVARVLRQLPANQVSDPIRTLGGYYIILSRGGEKIRPNDPQDVIVTLKQIFLPLSANAAPGAVQSQLDLALSVRSAVKGCDDIEKVSAQLRSPGPAVLGTGPVRNLSAAMQKLIKPLKPGQLSQPVRARDGFHMVMVCNPHKPNTALPTAAQMRNMLVEKRAELLAQNLMRELRQDAVVEIR